MALADGTSFLARVESFEPRRMFAFTPTGAAGTFGTNVTAVESAAAGADAGMTRYATYVDNAGAGFVVQVAGPDSSTPGTPIALPTMGGTISNTDVAAGADPGSFVVSYEVTTSTGGGMGGGPVTTDADIYALVYNNGVAVGSPTRVNSTTAGNQTDDRVAEDGSGNFEVVWQSDTGNVLVGRRFNADGTANGAEFAISSTGVEPDVAANSAGQFVITWSTATQTFAQQYSANGAVAQAAVTVANAGFSEPAVAMANSGRFFVAYAQNVSGVRQVFVQRYDASSNVDGAAITASDNAALNQNIPEIAVDTRGNFAVGWAQATNGTTYDAAAFRVFNAGGLPVDPASTVVSGVQFGNDFRFGLAYRLANTVNVAYASANVGNMQTFTNAGGGGGGGGGSGELPVPAGALLIDLTGSNVDNVAEIEQTSTNIDVTLNGVLTQYSRSTYTSIYVRGGNGNDYIRLHESVTIPAIIYGRDGADTLWGGLGNDVIDGGDGADVIQARAGNDTVYGSGDNDTLYGGDGNDMIDAGPGKNTTYGEDGNDTLEGGDSGDVMVGGTGNDSIDGNGGGDNLDGGLGNDTLNGGDGDDRLFGDRGNDFLVGGVGNDSLNGGRDNDSLYGEAGNDTLVGGANADLLSGGGGTRSNDPVSGGTTVGDIGYIDSLDTVRSIAFKISVR